MSRSTPEFGPVIRAMLRNKPGYVLIALQIAVTMATSRERYRDHSRAGRPDDPSERYR